MLEGDRLNLSILCRSDNGGLGTLSRLLCHGLPIFKRLAINRIHGERGDFCREPDERTRLVGDSITVADVHWLCDGADTLLSCETFYDPMVPRLAKQMGLRVTLCLMYEMTPLDAEWMQYVDDVLCPTGLDLDAANDTPGFNHARKVLLPIPSDVERILFTQRHRAETFVHRAGHQSEGRNGSIEIINAWPMVKSPARLVVYHQGELPCAVPADSRIECRKVNPPEYWQQDFATGDVCLHVSRHDALSLPIQEALTAGYPVIAADWWPHCDDGERKGYLPSWSQSNAVPVARTERRRISREFASHHVTPETVAARVDALYGADVSQASRDARDWAERRSWHRLRQQWIEALR